jgi:hypothetical protein
LIRAAATTAVVAGTAGAVRHHQDQKYAADEEGAAYEQGDEQGDEQVDEGAAPEPSYIAELEQLADLKAKGVITDDEFAAKKQQLLGL